jgi:hypothetical protein
VSSEVQTVADFMEDAVSLAVEQDTVAGLERADSVLTDAIGMTSAVGASEVESRECGRDSRGNRPRRIDPDDGRFIRLVVVGVALAGVVAFAISFTALYEVAGWLGLPPFMWWAVPVFIDLAILVYAASVLVHKARGERTLASWAALGTFTALSVFANAAHAWSYAQDHDQRWQGMVGAVIAGMVPVAIFVATEQLSRVAVEDPRSRRAELLEQTRMEQARAEHEQQLARLQFEREQQVRQMAHQRAIAERNAELDREQHRTEIAKLQARRDLEVRRMVQPVAGEHSPDMPQPETSTDRPSRDAATAERPDANGPHVVQDGTAATPETTSGARGSLDEVAEFVAQQASEGVNVSAAMLAERFGISERTGRRRMEKLRDERPEVFGHAVTERWKEQA